MFIFGGTVRDGAAAMESSVEGFVRGCADRFVRYYGVAPKRSECESWANSWPSLFRTLLAAGLGDLWLGMEFALPGSGERIDSLLLGARNDGGLTAVVVELKQWSDAKPVPGAPLRVYVGHREVPHPCRQAASYVRYLQTWLESDPLGLEVRAVALLHNASERLIVELRQAVHGQKYTAEVALIGKDDQDRPKHDLVDQMRCAGLTPPTDAQVKQFLDAPHAPTPLLFEHLHEVLRGDSAFVLVGAQQEAQLHLLGKVKDALRSESRHMLVVTGGPGTGKTVVAARLVADIPRLFDHPDRPCRARYLTQSGTLRAQLARAARDFAAKGLFVNVGQYLRQPPSKTPEVLLIDEAHRIDRSNNTITRLLDRARVSAFFLDERQIIKPNEGVTRTELEDIAAQAGITFACIDLTSQFRCGGSQNYLTWLGTLLYQTAGISAWKGQDYDIAVAADPHELRAWVDAHTLRGEKARITAGFCWPSTIVGPRKRLRQDVRITWTSRTTGERNTWSHSWNSKYAIFDDEGRPVAPESIYWATDPGGEQQVGCIYTAQGLEYAYGAVIFGPDLVRRADRWEAYPEESQDPVMRDLNAQEYLHLALNIYWVLLTRATRGCRVFSTDPQTQAFLQETMPLSLG